MHQVLKLLTNFNKVPILIGKVVTIKNNHTTSL